ncbi:hypothetical protein [Roseinatronobacter sp.]
MTTPPLHEVSTFERFTPSVLGQIVLAASDLCLIVSAENKVDNVLRGGALEDKVGAGWVGKQLRSVVSHDVWHKLDLLWSEQTDTAPVWRHLNFIDDHGASEIPLLVRRIAADNGSSVLVCRDLRPVVRMQQKFSHAMLEMEQSFEDTRWKQHLVSAESGKPVTRTAAPKARANVAMEKAITDIGQIPLSEIIAQTGRVLEDLCIRQAFEQCDYDLSKTADLLGISSDDLARRFAFETKRA